MLPALTLISHIRFELLEASIEKCSIKKMFLKILQYSLEDVSAAVSSLIKL